jgi:nitrate reductase alpha subunit
VVVKRGLSDEAHLRRTTSGPLLVRNDNGKFLKAADVSATGDAKTFMAYDPQEGRSCRTCISATSWH